MDTPRLIETGTGSSLEFRGKLLYSGKNPEKRPRTIAENLSLKDETLYILPSPLLFYGVQTIINNLPTRSTLLFIEKEAALFSLWEGLSENLSVSINSCIYLNNPGDEELLQKIHSIPGWPFRSVELIILNGGYMLNRQYYDRLFNSIDKAIRLTHQDRLTQVYFARRWMKNLFSNLAFSEGVQCFRNLKTEKPVLAAAAGESLETVLHNLKKNRNRFFILAADTALPVLCSNGIIPDAAVVLESQFINMRDFYGIPWQEIDLIADAYSHPPALRLPWKNRYLFYTRFSDLNYFKQVLEPAMPGYLFEAYGSVGVAAVAIGTLISRGGVYCTGLDFSYRLGKSHARGTQFGIQQLTEQCRTAPPGSFAPFMNRPMLIQTGKNGPVRTDLILLNYLNPLQRILKENSEIYDLNPKGLVTGAPVSKLPWGEYSRQKPDFSDNSDMQSQALNKNPLQYILQNELESLRRVRSTGYQFLTGEESGENLTDMIIKHDYLLAHFPDPMLPNPLTPDYLKRVLLAAEGYIVHLETLVNTG